MCLAHRHLMNTRVLLYTDEKCHSSRAWRLSIICTPPGHVPARFWLPFLLCPGWRVQCWAGNPVVNETLAAHGRLQALSTSHLGPCPRSAETLPFGPMVRLQSYALQALASAVTDTTCQILCRQLDTEEPATA